MALSVLVALMMLAVPLASSSNLFVDGGQTNSNGDAPTLGAAGDIITFELNIPENSLDTIDLTNATFKGLTLGNMIFSVDEKKNTILAIHNGAGTVDIADIISAVDTAIKTTFRGTAYTYNWIDSNGSIYYAAGEINSSFTLTAQWALNDDEYVEVNVNSSIDGVAQDVKTKAYAYNTYTIGGGLDVEIDKTQMVITDVNGLPVDESLIQGYVFNFETSSNNGYTPVYSSSVVDSSNKQINKVSGTDLPIAVSDLSVTYTFNTQDYKKVTISSNIFDEDVVLYADKTGEINNNKTKPLYTFNDVFVALGEAKPEGKTNTYINTAYTVKDKNEYTMENWVDGGETYSLTSTSTAGTELTLNADYNKFNVTFMVKGQVQVAEVLYGEFSESVCTLDTTGMTKWVKLPASGEITNSSVSIFNFNDPKLQDTITNNDLVLVALFTDPAKTFYVTFDAGAGYFGDKENNVQKIVVPISSKDATADQIILPNDPTNYTVAQGMKSVFAYWYADGTDTKYNFSNDVDIKDNLVLNAKYIDYKYVISFNADGNVIGHLYYDGASKLVAFEYNGIAYIYSDGLDAIKLKEGNDDSRALSALLYPTKAGYVTTEWKDADGNVMISDILSKPYDLATNPPKYEQVTGVTLHYDTVKSDMVLYANFEAKEYVIAYNGNTATMTNVLPQIGYVDQPLSLFGDSVFGNEGYVLKEWNTRPDGNGQSYALGSQFTLSGVEFEKLGKLSIANSDITDKEGFTLYAIWEKAGGSDVPGGNTGGDSNDNTALYLIAGMLAVIAILAIVGIVLMRKK